MAANAVDYNLWIAGTRVTSSNASNIRTGVKYDASGNKLTLTNATINSGSQVAIESSIENLTIEINGVCTINSGNDAIAVSGNTTIDGVYMTNHGTLNITTTGQTGAAIWAKGVKLRLYNLYLTAQGEEYCIYGGIGNNYGTIDMSCLEMTTNIKSGSNGAVSGFSSARFGTDAYLVNGDFNSSQRAICSNSTSSTKLSTVQTRGALYVGGIIVRCAGTSTDNLNPSAKTAGTISFSYSDKTLTLDNVTYSGSKRFIDNYKIDGLKVVVKGTNTISNSGNFSIRSNRAFSMEGATASYTDNKLKISDCFSAIYENDYNNEGGHTLLLKNLTLDLTATSEAAIGAATNGSTALSVENCKITASSASDYGAIAGMKSCQLTGCSVNTQETPVCFNAAKKGFADISQTLAKKVVIGVPTTTYDIYVLDEQLNNLNANNVVVDGLTEGTISYSNSDKTLTLNDVELTSTATDVKGIKVGVENAIINLKGANAITTDGDALFLTNKGVTMTGSIGIFRSTGQDGLSTNAGCGITLNGSDITFEGKRYGLYGGGGISEVMTLKGSDNNGMYYFKGGQKTIHNLTNLKLEGVDFWYSSGTQQTPGCYWDPKQETVCQNGGTVLKDWVAIAYIEKSYGITIGDVEITDCNAGAVGSKDILAGTVSYNAALGRLTLDGAKIVTTNSERFPSCIFNTKNYPYVKGDGVNDLTIYVKSDSELSSDKWSAINLWQNTTIEANGNAKLTLSGTKGDIFGNMDATITLKDINIDAAGYFGASSSNGKLNIDLKTADRRIQVKNGIYDWQTINLNDTKILEPTGAKLKSDNTAIVTSNGSTKAMNVVLGDKNATGIEGIEADTDVKVIGIYDAEGRRLNEMQPGVNILRMSDDTTRKVIKK